jgi:2'-hydroxyisoflavone reductase
LVTAALEKNHELTLFHRGNRNPYPHLENIIGNRETDLEKLAGRTWDAVIDTSAYVPRVAKISAQALADKVGRYCFISTVSVYQELTKQNHDENTTVATLETQTEEITGATYGALKALSENEINLEYKQNALVLRPGLIVGASDPSDRFTYWVDRIAKGGTVLAPAEPTNTVQFIDALSLARFTIQALEHNLTGTYNLNGKTMTMQHILETIRLVTNSNATFKWASEAFLEQHKINPWMGTNSLPLWIPGLEGSTSIEKALKAGLEFRNLEDIIEEVLQWSKTRENHVWRSGITTEHETKLLALLEQPTIKT